MKRGLAVVLLATDRFAALARAESAARGLADLPMTVLRHPSESDSDQDVSEAVDVALAGIEEGFEKGRG